ncbi:MAG: phosphatase PAP2 family protein [Anaerolineaceae bacterium]|nr:phosphatase PAP2 family protein [Anaerolineaceae bacterium]
MKLFSFLGQEEFFILLFPILYWCIDASLGLRLAVLLLSSNAINCSLKLAFHNPRPYWADSRVKAYTSETTFGIPSNHAQISTGIWGMLAVFIRRKWAYIGAGLIIFMIGVSRIYLGVHFTSDVLAGWLIGLIYLIGFLHWEKDLYAWFKGLTFYRQLMVSFLSSIFLILLMTIPALGLKSWQPPALWINNSRAAFPNVLFNPADISIAFTTAGTWLGLLVGVTWINDSYGGFTASGTEKQKSMRYLIGIVGLGILYFGMGSFFPGTANAVGYGLRFLRYALIGFWISGLGPCLFLRMKLAESLKDLLPCNL